MIRVLVVADRGAALAAITGSLCRLAHVDIAAYASGRARIDAIVGAVGPDVVVIDELRRPGAAETRIAEAVGAAPQTPVLGLSERADGPWTMAALRAGATAVVPRDLEPHALATVLSEVLGAARMQQPASTNIERSAA
jgi:DNA-binding NarL/FixJ family response regulator